MTDEGEFSDLIHDSMKANASGQMSKVIVESQGLFCAAKCFALITRLEIKDGALAAHY